MAETEFPISPLEIGIDQGTDFEPTPEREGPGLLKTLAPIAGGLALGGIPGLLLAAFGGAGAIGGAQSRSRENAFTQLSNEAELSPEQALQEPRILEAFASQMMTDPATVQQGQVFFQRAQQIRQGQAAEVQRVQQGETGLRSELESTFNFGELNNLATTFSTAKAFFEEGSPTAHTQLARLLEKMIDPSGVVRESDFVNIVGASPWAQRLEQQLRAGKVPASLVPDLMRAISLVAQAKSRQFNNSTAPRFRDLALANNLNPANVVFDPMQGLGVDEMLAQIPIDNNAEPGSFNTGINPQGSLADRALQSVLSLGQGIPNPREGR